MYIKSVSVSVCSECSVFGGIIQKLWSEYVKDLFEMNVSRYSTSNLYKANHTNELEEDGKIHLRIDYKVSGVGSQACGPELAEKYRLQEKEIKFSFSMQPTSKHGN